MATLIAKLALALCVVLSLSSSLSHAQTTCSSYTFTQNQVFTSCTDLPYLSAFLHWSFDQSTGKLTMAYRHPSTANWVSWAINPDVSKVDAAMPGAQALVAVPAGSGAWTAFPSPVTGYGITTLSNGTLSYDVTDLSAEAVSGEVIIFATWTLPTTTTTILQTWQEGPVDSSGAPGAHSLAAENRGAKGTLDLLSGTTAGGGVGSVGKKRNVHAVLNVVSWGILMPLGAMVARYLKTFKSADPAWFYLHAGCQTSAYIVGVAGWATGLKLGSDSSGVEYNPHRNIGITLFVLGTLQVFALLLRPNKDHKYRLWWSIYHHMTGYAVISLSIANIFEGFDILKPEKKWKNAYIGTIIALGVQAALLEAYTWFVVLKRKKAEKAGAPHHTNGVNNGYGA